MWKWLKTKERFDIPRWGLVIVGIWLVERAIVDVIRIVAFFGG